jgi:hypothetical protein
MVLAGLLGACYAPELLPGAPCRDSTGCPDDQQCVVGFCSTAAGSRVDAGPGAGDAAPGDAAQAIGCGSNDTCAIATTLGTLSGDTTQQALTARGDRAAWLRVRVTENDTTVTGHALRVLAKLTPPTGIDFEVVLHVNVASDVLECTTPLGVATTSGTMKQVRASWGEDVVADGIDNGRDVSIEVRPISGTCAAGATWQLSIEGNWN